ncbi:hypothetical protein [Mycobacterium sp. 94-17]|uniref:hypothetical protein n=1 Tax=Mycobacterium sp. 94-17 TaxID=2986147 RepID=UPI002D1F9663|nr:hypothetical protein [Mycobacterium sp. 94-17]MEB4210782.1 hypothetical protein [Mycobacterium sp. 94-17]
MVREEGGRWDVGIQNNAVYVGRISESDERVFDDSLSAEEARDLAGLLTKFAAKLEEASEKTEESKEDEDSKDDDDSKDDEDSEDEDKDKSD